MAMVDSEVLASAGALVDDIYYQGGLVERIGVYARQRMFDLFLTEMAPGEKTTILDVGASDVENQASNFLERLYPYPRRITAAGVCNPLAFKAAHPAIAFVPIEPSAPLPFADGAFDVVTSNAVLEHVGGSSERKAFLAELLRVGKRVFITVPNKWFPVEHHSTTPFLHWAPELFRSVRRKSGDTLWSDPDQLQFLDKGMIRREWPDQNRPPRFKWTGLEIGPWSSNLAVICE